MVSRSSSKKKSIHPSIKSALGYDANEPDKAVLKDWKERKTRVCKPCWELKYCPYGPLVEQSPFIPPLRNGMIEQMEYFKKCVETNLVGNVEVLSPESRAQYEDWLKDEPLLLRQAYYQLRHRRELEQASQLDSDEAMIDAWVGGQLPPIHIYRAPYSLETGDINKEDFSSEVWSQIKAIASEIKIKYQAALKSGSIDHRNELEPARAAWFRSRISKFDPDKYPDEVPDTFSEAQCNIFGHVCPVFFAAEAVTETTATRRRGRYIPFNVKMRVVRRDNYTCQHCKVHLRDDEVEFDHIIPIAKGGSSEEHNIRLTCFDCNRDKSDEYVP